MLFPTLFSLWVAFFAPLHGTEMLSVPQKLEFSQRLESDSAIIRHLEQKLKKHLESSAPEKIYVQLDRSLFQAGESVWFNAYIRNAGDLRPSIQSQMLYVELLDARGSIIEKQELLALNGTAAGVFDLNKGLPGGQYRIKAYTNWMRNTKEAFERSLTIQKVVLPNVNLKLEFERKAFGAGDMVIARFDAQSIDNKPIANQKIDFSASLEGKNFIQNTAQTDANGRTYVRFQLPVSFKSSDALLNIQLEYNGQQEAISRAIPIVLNQLDLQFFPESGDAVAGIPCNMAFKALNEFGKPADVEGLILDSKGNKVGAFSSFHDGMGAFEFVPQPDEHYSASLTKPFVSKNAYQLPLAKSHGVIIHLDKNDPNNLRVSVSGNHPGKVYLVGTQRDKLFYFKTLELNSNAMYLEIPTSDLPIGIVRLTALDAEKHEMAERLVFVGQNKGLNIELKTDKSEYLPREEVNLKIQVRDHKGKPVQGRFSLAVADEKLLTYADDKQGHILASLLLEQELKGVIEAPNFYFDPAEPKSEKALDYLLLTQGWRRFAWETVLNEAPIAMPFAPERAAIEGQIWRRDGKPIRGGLVTLYPNGPSVRSNKQGYFSFQNIDLDHYSHLTYGNGLYYAINDYRSDVNLRMPMRLNKGNIDFYMSPGVQGSTILSGKISDDIEGLIGATVKVSKGPDFVRGGVTDYNGEYRLSLAPGVYDIEISYTGFKAERITQVSVREGYINHLNVTMENSTVLEEVTIVAYKIPLIEQDQTSSGQTLSSEQIRNLPTRKVNAIVATTVGASSIDGGDVNIKGSRKMATDYYIDGIRITGGIPGVQEITSGNLNRVSTNRWQGYPRQFSKTREFYVPKYTAEPGPTARNDFRSTIYWNPNIVTDQSGKAEVQFVCSDAITNFRATLEGIGNEGSVGHSESKFFVQKPLSISVKTPASVIVGDVLHLQIALSNKTNYVMGGQLELTLPEHFVPKTAKSAFLPEAIQFAPGETKIIDAEYTITTPKNENQQLLVQFSTDELIMDAFETRIRTLNRGYPAYSVHSGNTPQNLLNIHLSDPVEGSIQATLTAYPSQLEDILKGMERMLRQPSGCFEQVSSSNYPNLLVLELLRATGKIRPEVETQAMKYLEDGYQRLIAYECKSGGFEWFGHDPGHEGLTAYGLLEFTDMARVIPIDPTMMERTSKWLRSKRDGKGGWTLNPQSLHGWQNDEVLVAYLAYAVAEAGLGQQFKPEIETAVQLAQKSKDPHMLALMANALFAIKDPRAAEVLSSLVKSKAPEGYWKGASHSAFRSQGVSLDIETTALTALALMKSGKYEPELQQAITFLAKSKTEYGYGNTQSTVLALKALVEYAKQTNKTKSGDGTLVVQIDGKRVEELVFASNQFNQLEINHLEQYFTNSDPQIVVFFEGDVASIPFDLEIKYASRTPSDAPNCPISFQTSMAQNNLSIGETVRLTALLKNESDLVQASPMIILGIPAGLSLQPWQLKKLMEEHQCDFYELWDGYAVFHFTHLDPKESRALGLDLRAEIAGTFEAPASQAYLYYQNEQRVWSKPERLKIQ